MTILEFMNLFPEFRASSWDAWRGKLARITEAVREFYAICGRGCGKSRMNALLATWFSSREYQRAPGESIYIGVFAPDRKQAGITFRYVLGLLHSVPALAALIARETRESIELSNGVVLKVITATKAAPRGRAYALVIIEEAAFLPTDQAAEPDVELLRSVRPALARVPGSLLCVVTSPYARRGIIWAAWQKYHDKPDGAVVLVQADTLSLNPTFDRAEIERAFLDDEPAARAEYGAEFRSDLEAFVSREAVEACRVADRLELPPVSSLSYVAFLDPSGGSSDSFTLAIAHREDERVILDLVRERKPPFSPESVCKEFADDMKRYRISSATSDRYAGEWPREQFAKHGISVQASERNKSEIYLELLPNLNSGKIELLDSPRLVAQLIGLERRTARGGKDSIDHAPGGHDDLINAAAGALGLCSVPVAHLDESMLIAGRRRELPMPPSDWVNEVF